MACVLYEEERFLLWNEYKPEPETKALKRERKQGIALAVTCSQNGENTEAPSRQMRLGLWNEEVLNFQILSVLLWHLVLFTSSTKALVIKWLIKLECQFYKYEGSHQDCSVNDKGWKIRRATMVRVRYVNTFPAVKSRGSTTMTILNWNWISWCCFFKLRQKLKNFFQRKKPNH